MGSRYARLLQLLWRKAPKRSQPPKQSIDSRLNTSAPNQSLDPSQQQNAQQYDHLTYPMQTQNPGQNFNAGMQPAAGFSWLDLGATWNFATQNGGTTSSSGSAGDVGDDGSLGLGEVSPFDMNLMTDYSLLEGDNPNLIF